MYDSYYKTPISFKGLIQKKELQKCSLEHSIAQYINLVATTSYGECKFDETFGCEIWEADFDLLTDRTTMENRIRKALIKAIKMHESRLYLAEVIVKLSEVRTVSVNKSFRMKKKVSVNIEGYIKKTNRQFNFHGYFFVGPLSYI